jgi:hypothetical protein
MTIKKFLKALLSDETLKHDDGLSRTASTVLIAQYETELPDKALLQSKLHEFYLQNAAA